MATWREIDLNMRLAFGRGSIREEMQRQRDEARNFTPEPDMGIAVIHVFAAPHLSKEALYRYCYEPVTPHGPEQINLDMLEASINTDLVEIAHGDAEIQGLLRELFFAPRQVGRLLAAIGPAAGCVLIPREAFDLADAILHDTEALRYVGSETRPLR